MTITVTTIGPLMAAASAEIPQDLQDAFSLSLLWSEAVTQQKSGYDIGTPSYFAGITDEIGKIGWFVTDAGTDKWSSTGAQTNAIGAMRSIARQYIPKSQVSPLLGMLQAISQTTTKDAFGQFLTNWWSSLDQKYSGQVFSASPVVQDSTGTLAATIAFMDFGTRQDSWQSFFLGQLSQSATIVVRHTEIRLSAALWKNNRDLIAQKLGERAQREIRRIDI